MMTDIFLTYTLPIHYLYYSLTNTEKKISPRNPHYLGAMMTTTYFKELQKKGVVTLQNGVVTLQNGVVTLQNGVGNITERCW